MTINVMTHIAINIKTFLQSKTTASATATATATATTMSMSMSMSCIIPIMATWHLIFMEISKHKPEAVSKNLNHLLHSLIFIAHYASDYNLSYATHISIGFYLYDTVCLMQSAMQLLCVASVEKIIQKATATGATATGATATGATATGAATATAPYLLHHAITIYLLNIAITDPVHAASMLRGYCILETSNIMLYVSYHVRKEHADRKELIMLSELVQLGWYTYYRIFKLTAFLYTIRAEAFQLGIGGCAMLATVYAMGVLWSYKLLIKNMRNCKTIA